MSSFYLFNWNVKFPIIPWEPRNVRHHCVCTDLFCMGEWMKWRAEWVLPMVWKRSCQLLVCCLDLCNKLNLDNVTLYNLIALHLGCCFFKVREEICIFSPVPFGDNFLINNCSCIVCLKDTLSDCHLGKTLRFTREKQFPRYGLERNIFFARRSFWGHSWDNLKLITPSLPSHLKNNLHYRKFK